MTPLERITERINRNGDINDPATPCPLLTLEEFFEGNEDGGSIGCNVISHAYLEPPAPHEFYALLKRIRERPDVANVLVQVDRHEMPKEWPYAEFVWVITLAAPAELASWLEDRFFADEVLDGWDDPALPPHETHALPEGMRPVGIWWD